MSEEYVKEINEIIADHDKIRTRLKKLQIRISREAVRKESKL